MLRMKVYDAVPEAKVSSNIPVEIVGLVGRTCENLASLATSTTELQSLRRLTLLTELAKAWADGKEPNLVIESLPNTQSSDRADVSDKGHDCSCSSTNNDVTFQCTLCSQSFRTSTALMQHLFEHNTETLDKISKGYEELDELGAEEMSPFEVSEIMDKEDTFLNDVTSSVAFSDEGLDAAIKQEINMCGICSKIFKTAKGLERHELSHASGAVASSSDRPYTCCTCNMSFGDSRSLKRHLFVHTGEKPFLCCDCGRGFTRNSDLKAHSVLHNDTNCFRCHLCNCKFTRASHLKRHSLKHTGERRHVCSWCGKGFFRADELRSHERRHDKSNPFACPQCDKRFSRSRDLERHLVTHTKVERPHPCGFCGKKFRRLVGLRNHQTTHEKQSCLQCDAVFFRIRDYKRHLLSSHGNDTDTVFSCTLCDKKFLNMYRLSRHSKTHELEKDPNSTV